MGAVNNTDNLGTTLKVGDHVGYIYGCCDHYRIHSGIIMKLCPKTVWIKPDEDFINDARIPESTRNSDWYKKYHPKYKHSKRDDWYLSAYGRTVKLGY